MGTTEETAIARATQGGVSLLKKLAAKYNVEENNFFNTIVQTVFTAGKAGRDQQPTPGRGLAPTKEMVMTFLIVADKYDLDPFLKQIYPFIDSQGNLRVIVGIDGWIAVALRHPDYDGHEFRDHLDQATNQLLAVTCKIHRRDRTRPIEMTEYMSECKRDTEPWNKWPSRMLHHKAFIQTARYALGMGDIIEEDELDRIESVRGASHEVIASPQRSSAKQVENRTAPALPAETSAPAAAPNASDSAPSREAAKAEDPEPQPPANEPLTSAQVRELQKIGFENSHALVDQNQMLKARFGVSKMQELRAGDFAEAARILGTPKAK